MLTVIFIIALIYVIICYFGQGIGCIFGIFVWIIRLFFLVIAGIAAIYLAGAILSIC